MALDRAPPTPDDSAMNGKRTAVPSDAARVTAGRRHRALPHTADAGFTATAPSLPQLFEESAAALSDLTTSRGRGVEASSWEQVVLDADDLPGLAFAWLNELIALADIHRAAIVATAIDRLEVRGASAEDGRWHLESRVGLRATSEPGVRVLRQLKSATYHGLTVEGRGTRWTMRAYVDV
jgi:SHS2 domain-containing protein